MKKFVPMLLISTLLVSIFTCNVCMASEYSDDENENENNVEDFQIYNRNNKIFNDEPAILEDDEICMAPNQSSMEVNVNGDQNNIAYIYIQQIMANKNNNNDDECYDIFNSVPNHLFSQYKKDDEDYLY